MKKDKMIMYREEFYDAMISFMDDKGYKRCYMDYKGWSDATGMKFSAQRLAAMYKKNMVDRHKDGGCYVYQPLI